MPTEVPTAPQSVTAEATPSVTKSVTVSWTAPASGAPIDSYVLYRSIEPDIAGDLTKAQKIEDATSPYVDAIPAGGIPYYYVIAAVNSVGEGAVSTEATATPTVPASGDTGFGNNLSVPLVFANGVGVTGEVLAASADSDYLNLTTGLRPTSSDTTDPWPYLLASDTLKVGGVDFYAQKNASSWQASWKNGGAALQSVVVDWGDNLRTASITTALSIIRVETNLLQNKRTAAWPDTESMKRFPMQLLAGQGATEVQGTTGVAEEATQRRVFTVNARLTIKKLTGTVDPACEFDNTIYGSFDLPDSDQTKKYTTEVNVGGAITYGYNWRLSTCPGTAAEKAGTWRITFSLDPTATYSAGSFVNNVSMDEVDPSDVASPKVFLAPDGLSTYIDVEVTEP